MNLTECQSLALDELKCFIASNKSHFCLNGAGGTGKTFILKMIITALDDSEYVFLAPTHKAVQILKSSSIRNAETIHKYLCFNSTYDESGNNLFIPDKNAWTKLKASIIFIDECSMIDNEMFRDLLEFQGLLGERKLIFIGDSQQLPPISSEMNSISLSFETPNKVTLRTNMRAKNEDIITINKLFRKYTIDYNINILTSKLRNNNTIMKIYCNKQKFLFSFVKELAKNKNTYIIACSNAQVEFYNKAVMKLIYGVGYNEIENKFFEGLKLVVNNYFKVNDKALYTSDTLMISKTEITTITSDYFNDTYKCFRLETSSHIGNVILHYVHNDDIFKLKDQMKAKKTEIKDIDKQEKIKLSKGESKRSYISSLWNTYYSEVNMLLPPIASAYAITTYKSQGSTFNAAYVDFANIYRCRDDSFTRSRELYTAVSRASNKIVLFTSNLLF